MAIILVLNKKVYLQISFVDLSSSFDDKTNLKHEDEITNLTDKHDLDKLKQMRYDLLLNSPNIKSI